MASAREIREVDEIVEYAMKGGFYTGEPDAVVAANARAMILELVYRHDRNTETIDSLRYRHGVRESFLH